MTCMVETTCACGETIWTAPGEPRYERCWQCANQALEQVYLLCAPCDPDTDRENCNTWPTCPHASVCAVLAGVTAVKALDGSHE